MSKLLSIRSNYKDALKWLDGIQRRQMPFATMTALNSIAFKCRSNVKKTMQMVIDRPTPFTLRAFLVDKAQKRRLTSRLYAHPIQEKYLAPLVYGGTETKKHIVPGKNANLNQYGNLKRRESKKPGTWNVGNKVYRLKGRGKNRRPILVGHFPKTRHYRPIFHYDSIVERTYGRHFSKMWNAAFKRAMLTAR